MSNRHWHIHNGKARLYESGCSYAKRSPYIAVADVHELMQGVCWVGGVFGVVELADHKRFMAALHDAGFSLLLRERKGKLEIRTVPAFDKVSAFAPQDYRPISSGVD